MNPHKMTTTEEKPHQKNLFKELVMETATRSHVISITSWLNRISITSHNLTLFNELAMYSVQRACDADQATSRCCWRLHHELVEQKKRLRFLVR